MATTSSPHAATCNRNMVQNGNEKRFVLDFNELLESLSKAYHCKHAPGDKDTAFHQVLHEAIRVAQQDFRVVDITEHHSSVSDSRLEMASSDKGYMPDRYAKAPSGTKTGKFVNQNTQKTARKRDIHGDEYKEPSPTEKKVKYRGSGDSSVNQLPRALDPHWEVRGSPTASWFPEGQQPAASTEVVRRTFRDSTAPPRLEYKKADPNDVVEVRDDETKHRIKISKDDKPTMSNIRKHFNRSKKNRALDQAMLSKSQPLFIN